MDISLLEGKMFTLPSTFLSLGSCVVRAPSAVQESSRRVELTVGLRNS